jgi:putative ABC transport system substrate-binding protein
VKIEYRWARGDSGRLPVFAAEFVNHRVNLLVATGGDASARAAKAATSVISIVFTAGGDPIEAGLVENFNRPGGNEAPRRSANPAPRYVAFSAPRPRYHVRPGPVP